MPRANTGPRLVLYGPDDRHGARPRKGFRQYLWYIVWYAKGAKCERATGFGLGQESAAGEFLSTWLAEHAARNTSRRRPDQITVAEILDFYAVEHAPGLADAERIGIAIDNLLPWLGEKTVDEIFENTRKQYALDRGRAPATVVKELAVLDAAARHCVRNRYLTLYPDDQWFPQRPEPGDRYLTRQEAAKLIRAARRPPPDPRAPSSREHLPLFLLLGLYTGRRKEAILALQWHPNTQGGWVDLENNRIDFYAIKERRTKKRKGIIPIPHRLRRFLVAARERTRSHVIEFEGKPMKSVKRSFGSACRAAGAAFDDVHPHILRHTLATWLSQQGVPEEQAADFLEMSVEVYRRRYRKYHPDYMAAALAAMR